MLLVALVVCAWVVGEWLVWFRFNWLVLWLFAVLVGSTGCLVVLAARVLGAGLIGWSACRLHCLLACLFDVGSGCLPACGLLLGWPLS